MSMFNSIQSANLKTNFTSKNYEFSWTMDNLQKWPSFCKISSKTFQPRVGLTFRFDFSKDDTNCSFWFVAGEGCREEIKHNLSFLDSKGNILWRSIKVHKYTNEKFHLYFFFGTDYLNKLSSSSPDKIIILQCIMELGSFNTDTFVTQMPNHLKNLTVLAEDLNKVYNNSLAYDFNILVENKKILVHKSILHATSPVFAKMLECPSNFKNNNIEIEDIKFSTMQNFLKFLYTGKLSSDDFESVFELYPVADKYDVENLQETCADVLVTKMDTENASRVLSLANRYSDGELKDSALKFMRCRPKI